MKIKAIAPWFGSKRKLAPRIVEAIGPHTSYWEPFCGGLSVLLAKPPCRMETVNDLHDFEADDHRRLAESVRRFRNARVVVSDYDHPRLRELYDGWTHIDCTVNKNMAVNSKRGAKPKKAPEVLLVNTPSKELFK